MPEQEEHPDGGVYVRRGAPSAAWQLTLYHSSPGVQRGFCNRCGTSLTYASDRWTDVAVLTATLDDPPVAVHVQRVSRAQAALGGGG